MLLLIQLLAVISMFIFIGTKAVDNMIRKWFGLRKVTERKESFNKYETWIKVLVLLSFAIVSYVVGIESIYIYIVILLFCVTFYGLEALLEKTYMTDSKDYIITFLAGIMKSLLLIILVVIYDAAS